MASAIFHIVKCAQCGEREAIIFMRRSEDSGESRDLFLCSACAKSRGIVAGKGSLDLNIDDLISAGLDEPRGSGSRASCPSCALELEELRRGGALGCPSCADAFPEEILRARRGKALRLDEAEIGSASPAKPAQAAALGQKLALALAAEDYEEAAKLRDTLALAQECDSRAASLSSIADYRHPLASCASLEGSDDDVVLWSSAIVYRALEGFSFPPAPRRQAGASRATLLPAMLSLGGWTVATMAELGPLARRSLAERGILSREYAADGEAPFLSSATEPCYALLDEGDHLKIRVMRPALDLRSALEGANAQAARIASSLPFAQRPGLGWICAKASDCGLGASLSALVHIPALAATGLRDRLLGAVMAEGLVVRGYYSSAEDSSGSVYEIVAESAAASSFGDMTAILGQAVAKLARSERRARSELAVKGRAALADAEGRAFGIAMHCGLLGAEEGASLLSVLRLASLRGSLSGVDPRALGSLLVALGPGSVALASNLAELPAGDSAEALRASLVKKALAGAEYRIEEGAECSRD
jgi:protein arginine kinase